MAKEKTKLSSDTRRKSGNSAVKGTTAKRQSSNAYNKKSKTTSSASKQKQDLVQKKSKTSWKAEAERS